MKKQRTANQKEIDAKVELQKYGKQNQQCLKHQKVSADETKTENKGKEKQGDKLSTGDKDKNNKNTTKTNKL